MTDLSELLRGGSFTLEGILDELRRMHYIVEGRGPIGRFCSRTTIHIIEKDFFSEYESATGTRIYGISLLSTASEEGFPGNFTYALFNAKKVSLDQIREILKWTNIVEAARNAAEEEITRIDQDISEHEDGEEAE